MQQRDFVVLWAGQTLSVFGSAVSVFALPSVAILVLHATPFQLGLLEALAFAAFPLLGLFVGVLADRTPRRRVMIVADLVRAAALASIPLAAAAHVLGFTQLAIVALVTGVGTVFFDICYQSYLPSLIAAPELSRANARLEFTRSAAEVGGNGLAGVLISAVGAATAVGVDALSFVVSVTSLLAIRKPEAPPVRADRTTTVWDDLRVGVACVLESPLLRTIAACTATSNLGQSMISAVLLIFAYRQLHLHAATLGLVFALANVGFIGAALATRSTRRFGLGTTLVASNLIAGMAPLFLPLALYAAPVVVLFAVTFVQTVMTPIYNINQVSLRQTIVPQERQGRMNATMRTIVWGTMPVGALAGGVLGNTLGIVPTILIGGAITSSASLWILFGPARRLRSIESAARTNTTADEPARESSSRPE